MRWSLRTDRVKIGRLFRRQLRRDRNHRQRRNRLRLFRNRFKWKKTSWSWKWRRKKGWRRKRKKKQRERLRRREARWRLQRLEQWVQRREHERLAREHLQEGLRVEELKRGDTFWEDMSVGNSRRASGWIQGKRWSCTSGGRPRWCACTSTEGCERGRRLP